MLVLTILNKPLLSRTGCTMLILLFEVAVIWFFSLFLSFCDEWDCVEQTYDGQHL